MSYFEMVTIFVSKLWVFIAALAVLGGWLAVLEAKARERQAYCDGYDAGVASRLEEQG